MQLTTLSATVPSFTCEIDTSSFPLDSRLSVSLSLLTSAPALAKHLSGTPTVCHLPAGTPHYAVAETESVVQINGFGPFDVMYVNPKDDPRAQ